MAPKEVHFRSDARAQILRGATALVDAVRITLGPKSKCVLIGQKWGKPKVCNDGVTIAKAFELQHPVENLGVQMMREAAERTGEQVGDGTTTACLLAHAIFSEGLRNVTAGASAVGIRRGLERALQRVLQTLQGFSRQLQTHLEKTQVATVSAHNDAAIGELVAKALEKVGYEGAIAVEESRTAETSLEMVEGLKFEHGYISPYFVTHPDKMEAVLENPLILWSEKKLSHLGELLPLLEAVAKSGKPLLLVAEDVDGDALATLVVNKLRGILPAAAVKAPGFGERRKALLQDMAILCGGNLVSDELGVALEKLQLSDLGSARRVVITKDATTLIGGGGSREALHARCAELRRQLEDHPSEYEREKLQERLSKLLGGVAVIRVGAPSEAEMLNRKEAFDDAISATKAAMSEGIVPGGGLALLRCIPALEQEAQLCSEDERTGVLILRKALEAPARQIAENSAADAGVVIHLMRQDQGNLGFDAAQGKYSDLLEAGILDPTKVVRIALEHAVSTAGTLLFTEATLTELPEKKPKTAPETEWSDETP